MSFKRHPTVSVFSERWERIPYYQHITGSGKELRLSNLIPPAKPRPPVKTGGLSNS